MSNWKSAYEARTDLAEYDDNGLALFALALKFGLDDLDTIAADAITDGSDDKKLDMVYINEEEGYAVISQCYASSVDKASAPANKASDLNTGIGWLFQRNIEEVPDRIKSAAIEIRTLITDNIIKKIHIWYVHNLPESQNVKTELVTVQQSADTIFKNDFPDAAIDIQALEVGANTFENWYEETQSPILVNDEIAIDTNGGYELQGPKWKSYSTAISAQFLYRMFKKHKTDMFSANIRNYLGSRFTDSNINNGIQKTVLIDPENFWVYNNGLTILTHSYTVDEKKITVKGLSVVNGAQTTGAIGSLSELPDSKTKVQARFVMVTDTDQDLIHNIIENNNRQNKVEASDFRSTDKIQQRLKNEFQEIPDSEYEGGRRGGSAGAIRRRANLLPSYTVGQALACFQQEPLVAYNQKTKIWIDDELYSKYFNEQTKAAHIVCAYSLFRTIEGKKKELMDKSKKENLTSQEELDLTYFRQRGSIFLLSSAIVSCLEIFLARRVPDIHRISFGSEISPSAAEYLWKPIVDVTLPFSEQLNKGLIGGLKNRVSVTEVIRIFASLVQATEATNRPIFEKFADKVTAPE